MTTKQISNLRKKMNVGSDKGGCYGEYYQITKTKGIKIANKSFLNEKKLKASKQYKDFVEEFNFLKFLKKTDLTPKPYELLIFKHKNRFYVGIVMQHFDGPSLSDKNHDDDKESKIIARLHSKLTKHKINHKDLHANNIICHKKKYRAIDFSADFIFKLN